jgi:hypothetical protein
MLEILTSSVISDASAFRCHQATARSVFVRTPFKSIGIKYPNSMEHLSLGITGMRLGNVARTFSIPQVH